MADGSPASPPASGGRPKRMLADVAKARTRCRCCFQLYPSSSLRDHPMGLQVGLPARCMCVSCYQIYNAVGTWSWKKNDQGKDEFCRICGEGNLGTVSCDRAACTYSFCEGCVLANTGQTSYQRILEQAERGQWHCFACTIAALIASAENTSSTTHSYASPLTLPVGSPNRMRAFLHLTARAAAGGFTKRTIFDAWLLPRPIPRMTYFDGKFDATVIDGGTGEAAELAGGKVKQEVDDDEDEPREVIGLVKKQLQFDTTTTTAATSSSPPSSPSTRSPSPRPTKKLISFSFFLHELHRADSHTPYVFGLLENIRRIWREWKGWTIRIYWDDSFQVPAPAETLGLHAPPEGLICKLGYHIRMRDAWYGTLLPLLRLLEKRGLVELRRFNWPHFQDKDAIHHGAVGCFARFLALADLGKEGGVERVVMADVDNHLTPAARSLAENMSHSHQRFHDPRYSVPLWAGGFAARIPDGVDIDQWVNPYAHIEAELMHWCITHCRAPTAILARPEMFATGVSPSSSNPDAPSNIASGVGHHQATMEHPGRRGDKGRKEMERRREEVEAARREDRGKGRGGEGRSDTTPALTDATKKRSFTQRPEPLRRQPTRIGSPPSSQEEHKSSQGSGRAGSRAKREMKEEPEDDPAEPPSSTPLSASLSTPSLTLTPVTGSGSSDIKGSQTAEKRRSGRVSLQSDEIDVQPESKSNAEAAAGSTPAKAPPAASAAAVGLQPDEEDDDDCVEISAPPRNPDSTPSLSQKGRANRRRPKAKFTHTKAATKAAAIKTEELANDDTRLSPLEAEQSQRHPSTIPSEIDEENALLEFFPYGSDQVFLADVVWPVARQDCETIWSLLPTAQLAKTQKVWPPVLTAEEKARVATAPTYWSMMDWMANAVRPKANAIGAFVKRFVATKWSEMLKAMAVEEACASNQIGRFMCRTEPMDDIERKVREGVLTFTPIQPHTIEAQLARAKAEQLAATSASGVSIATASHHGSPVAEEGDALDETATAASVGKKERPTKRSTKPSSPAAPKTVAASASGSAAASSTVRHPRLAKRRLNLADPADLDEAELEAALASIEADREEEMREAEERKEHADQRKKRLEAMKRAQLLEHQQMADVDHLMEPIAIEEVAAMDAETGIVEMRDSDDEDNDIADRPATSGEDEEDPLVHAHVEEAIERPKKKAKRMASEQKPSEPVRSASAVKSKRTTEKSSAPAAAAPAIRAPAARASTSHSTYATINAHFLDECEWGCTAVHDAYTCQVDRPDGSRVCANKDHFRQVTELVFHAKAPRPTTPATNTPAPLVVEQTATVDTAAPMDTSEDAPAAATAATAVVAEQKSDQKSDEANEERKKQETEDLTAEPDAPDVAGDDAASSSLDAPAGAGRHSSRSKRVPMTFGDFVDSNNIILNSAGAAGVKSEKGPGAAGEYFHATSAPKNRVACTCRCTFCAPKYFTAAASVRHPEYPSTAWPWSLAATQLWLNKLGDVFIPLSMYLGDARVPTGLPKTSDGYDHVEQLINTHPTKIVKLIRKAKTEYGGVDCMPTLLAFSLHQKLARLREVISQQEEKLL